MVRPVDHAADNADIEAATPDVQDLLFAAYEGVGEGDWAPLAKYIRAGLAIPGYLGDRIADAIEGAGGVPRITTQVRAKRGLREVQRQFDRKLALGREIEKQMREARHGEGKRIVADLASRWGVSESVAHEARALFKNVIEGRGPLPMPPGVVLNLLQFPEFVYGQNSSEVEKLPED